MYSDVPINEFIGEVEDLLVVIDRDLNKISQSMDNQDKIDSTVFENLFRSWHSLSGLFQSV
jgi:archaellum component FlaC